MPYNTDIERLNYYEGEFLGATDFQAEQEYHRDMRRRHNLGQHTWGIVTGLDLAQPANGYTDGSTAEVDVYLQPGMAVDGFGREIVVLSQTQLTPEMFAAFPGSGAGTMNLYVWIGFQQALLQPPSSVCTSMNVSNAYGRIEETYTLTVTASKTPPPNSAIVVNGTAMAQPVQSSSSSSSSSPGAPALTDPPQITLPSDDSVPFQEFSTDDSNLIWWLPLGFVQWDPSNQVFLQIDPDPVKAAAASGANREYAGNVSATLYAPAGTYTVVDREAPYPLPTDSTDPNYQGVQAEVAGTLQVDRYLSVNDGISLDQANANSGALNPGLTFGRNSGEGIASQRTGANQYGLNFYTGSALQMSIASAANGGKVSVTGSLNVDQANLNTGAALNPGLSFGSNSGEGIASQRTGTNEYGLNFYTGSALQMSIASVANGGKVSVTGSLNVDQANQNTGAALNPGLSFGGNSGEGIASQRTGTNKYGLNFYTGSALQMSIASAAQHGKVSVTGSLNVDQANQNTGAALNPGLSFGSNSGEGIASQRTGTNEYGLNFYTGSALQMSIASAANGGKVSVTGSLNVDQANQNTGGTLNPGLSFGLNSGEGIASQRTGTNEYGLNFYTGSALQMSIASAAQGGGVSLTGSLNIDQANLNPGGTFAAGPNHILTFGSAGTGEGIGSCRKAGGTNQNGLDFYTDFQPRLSIDQSGAVTIGSAAVSGNLPQPGALTINGNRTYLLGTDAAQNHWIMAGGASEPQNNAIGFNGPNKQVIIGSASAPWDVTVYGNVNGTKVGYVADRFISRDGVQFERGDVVVLHSTPSSQYYGSDGQIPLVEVQLAETALDTRVCGIVDEPALADSKIHDLDRTKLGSVQVGLMVTLGAYAYCKVDADIAPISPGDLLTTSPTRGCAQKLDSKTRARPGAIIGKALGSLKKGKGTIPLLVSHQ